MVWDHGMSVRVRLSRQMAEKICTLCKESKDVKDFNKNKSKKDGLNNLCKECSKSRSKTYYNQNGDKHKEAVRKRNKEILIENRIKIFEYLKSNPCLDCNEADPIVLEFDHRDDVEKIAEVGKLVANGYKWETIKEEIDKCDVRCANCHRRRTAKQFNWYNGFYNDSIAQLVE